jgi:HAD superfamily hydrolase (TIGR01490 family)
MNEDRRKNKGFAFFDVDGTLTTMRTMMVFHNFWYKKWLPSHGMEYREEDKIIRRALYDLEKYGAPREVVNRYYYGFFEGRCLEQVKSCVRQLYRQVSEMSSLFINETLNELYKLRLCGVEPVFVSGSFEEVLEPLARYVEVKYVLSNKLQVSGKYCTGQIKKPQIIGKGKALAIRQFIHEQGGVTQNCYAFGDHLSDLHMLKLVKNPVVVKGDVRLARFARKNGWQIIVP